MIAKHLSGALALIASANAQAADPLPRADPGKMGSCASVSPGLAVC